MFIIFRSTTAYFKCITIELAIVVLIRAQYKDVVAAIP